MDLIVSYGDVVTRGPVTQHAWRQARKQGRLKKLEMRFEYGRERFLASHVEEVFGLPAGSLREEK